MQYHLNGYKAGDPFVHAPHPSVAERPGGLPDEVDVLIVGCGPAGLVLAAQLASFPDITTAIVDRKDGPLEVGQADGVACRTVEMFEAFGLGRRLINEAYWVNEVSFWRPDPEDRTRIKRTGRVQDTEAGLSELFSRHGRVHKLKIAKDLFSGQCTGTALACSSAEDCDPGNNCIYGCCVGRCGFNIQTCSSIDPPNQCGGEPLACAPGETCSANGCCGIVVP